MSRLAQRSSVSALKFAMPAIFLTFLMLVLNPPNAGATTYVFSGTVADATYYHPADWVTPGPVLAGEAFTGYFSYFVQGTPQPVHVHDPDSAVYLTSNQLELSYAIYFSNLQVYSSPGLFFSVTNDSNDGDVIRLEDITPRTVPTPIIATAPLFILDECYLTFLDHTARQLDSSMASANLALDLFDECRIDLYGICAGYEWPYLYLNLSGTIQEIHEMKPVEMKPVPEPSIALLLCVGLAGLAVLRRSARALK